MHVDAQVIVFMFVISTATMIAIIYDLFTKVHELEKRIDEMKTNDEKARLIVDLCTAKESTPAPVKKRRRRNRRSRSKRGQKWEKPLLQATA